MASQKGRRVLVEKIDLDTAGAAYLLGVTREDKVEVLRGVASSENLLNAEVICIEVGGSGHSQLNNWDHHGPDAPPESATLQVWQRMEAELLPMEVKAVSLCVSSSLVNYIDQLDTKGLKALGQEGKDLFPTLSNLFSGMLLTERDPVEQLHRGVAILRKVVQEGIDPYGRMPIEDNPEWTAYAEAKAENNRQIAKAVEEAQRGTTAGGLKLAWLETDFFGAPGALYGVGAQVVVAYSRHFGPERVPKFTIAGNGIKVDAVLSELNARESGWGGPPTGTIIGSPREGSQLTLEEVVEVVWKGL